MGTSSIPFQVQHIDHVVLRARDAGALIEFYSNVLGCKLERELDIGLSQLRAGSTLIDIVDANSSLGAAGGSLPDATDGANLDHFCLRVEPFDPGTIIEHLRSCGSEPTEPREVYGAEGFGPSIYLNDPEGNRVELKGPAVRPPLRRNE